MSGHPVDDDADTGLMEGVDQVAKVVGGAEARRGSEVGRHLIAPGRPIWMLGNGEKLDMGVCHIDQVCRQFDGKLAIGETGAPRTQVDLVDRHGLLVVIDRGTMG